MTLFSKLIDLRIAKFILIGVLATLTHVIIFVALIELADLAAVVASIPSFVLATLVSYSGNYNWTFGSNGLHRVQIPKYIVVAIIGLILNVAITYMIVDIWGGWYGLALVVVIFTVPAITYQLNHHWVFKKTEHIQDELA